MLTLQTHCFDGIRQIVCVIINLRGDIMIFLIVIILLVIYFIKRIEQKPKDTNINNNQEINYKNMYKPKRYIISLTELNFYNILLEITKELDLILFSQVSLYNIIETKYNNQSAFNKIKSKTIDFVLVDKNNCRIKLCIELDDYTHNRYDRIERDKFVNKLFSDLEIDLIRFKASNYYNKEALKKRIQESIHEHYYQN